MKKNSSTIEAVAGHSASIPCSVPTPLSEDAASLILWYKTDLPNPIYTLDVRSGARHFPASEYEGRARFDVGTHPPVLVIRPVIEGDRGEYKCRVDLKRSRTLILHSKLEIIVPPGVPIIMDEHGQHLHDVVGPYDEGTTLLFVCEVDGGDPSPDVTWWRGDVLVDDSFNVTTQGFVRNDIVVERIERRDWMTQFSCRASNNNATDPTEASLQIDMNLYPLSTRIAGPELPMVTGVEQKLICETSGSRPPVLTSWWLGGSQLYEEPPDDPLADDANLTLSILKITPKVGDDGKKVVCKTVNPVLQGSTRQAEVQLQVHYPPILNLTTVPSGIIREGDDVYLSCSIRANPEVGPEVTWEYDGRTDRPQGTLQLNRTLLLQKVRRDQQGEYRCSATNLIGTGVSNTLKLVVQYAPVCRWPDHIIFGISPTDNVSLTCDVVSNPSYNLTYQWSFLNASDTSAWVIDEDTPSLNYSPQNDNGYGVFECRARNSVGLQQQPCVFKVMPAGPPEPPHNCTISNHTSSTATVECKPGYDGSLPQVFHVEVYNSASETLVDNLTSTTTSYNVDGLTPGTSYVLVVYTSNAKGRSKSTALLVNTLSSAKKRTAREVPGVLSPLLGILIGIVLLFLIASAAIVASIKCKKKKKRNCLKKDFNLTEIKSECEMEKKELDEGQEAGGASVGPDIIPLSKDQEVFHLEGYLEELRRSSECLQTTTDSPPTEYIRMKYMHTVL